MKKTFIFSIVTLLVSSLLFFGRTPVSYADEYEHNKKTVQSLKDASAALKTSNPDLSDKLSKYADKESLETEKGEGKEEAGENEEAEIKLLRDSAAALNATNPKLSAKLTRYADREEKEAKEEKK